MFEYENYNGDDIYRATLGDNHVIVYNDSSGNSLILRNKASDDYDDFENLSGTDELPLRLTLYGKTKNGKYYYAEAWNYGDADYKCSGYIPVDTKAFVDVYLDYDAAYEIFEEINKERIKAGVEPLVYDYNIEKYAMFRAKELYVKFDHYGPDETAEESWNLYMKYIVPYNDFHSENIYRSYVMPWSELWIPSAKEINAEWVASSGHYATMITEGWKTVGVGVYRTEQGTFAVQYYGDNYKE